MSKILFEQTGLKVAKNEKNGFCVITLHYTADPAKQSTEWYKEASAGMHPAKFAQEYEIDYTALYGEKVFPEISTSRNKIIINQPYPEINIDQQSFWGGFDYGGRSPASFHVYTIVDGVTYAIWELFEPCKSISEFSKKLLECPYWKNIRYVSSDPSIWWKNQQSKYGNLTSIAAMFMENKVTKLVPSITDEQAWIATMRQHWQNPDDITFKIFDCCPNMIREFDSAVYVSASEKMLLTKNYNESISDHDNHSLDDCKYFMNSRPQFQRKKIVFDKMVRKWRN